MQPNNLEINKEPDPMIQEIDHFLGFTKLQFIVAFALIMILIVTMFGTILFVRVNNNAKTLDYICNVSNTLDNLVTDAGNQIQTNFNHGVYAKLVKKGVFTRANIIATRHTLESYRQTHLALNSNNACHMKK